jgi:hypothetical protein
MDKDAAILVDLGVAIPQNLSQGMENGRRQAQNFAEGAFQEGSDREYKKTALYNILALAKVLHRIRRNGESGLDLLHGIRSAVTDSDNISIATTLRDENEAAQ